MKELKMSTVISLVYCRLLPLVENPAELDNLFLCNTPTKLEAAIKEEYLDMTGFENAASLILNCIVEKNKNAITLK